MSCACKGLGLMQVNYSDGHAADVGICSCRAAQPYRRLYAACLDVLAHRIGVRPDQLWLIEELADDKAELRAWGLDAAPPRESFTAAGQRRAKL